MNGVPSARARINHRVIKRSRPKVAVGSLPCQNVVANYGRIAVRSVFGPGRLVERKKILNKRWPTTLKIQFPVRLLLCHRRLSWRRNRMIPSSTTSTTTVPQSSGNGDFIFGERRIFFFLFLSVTVPPATIDSAFSHVPIECTLVCVCLDAISFSFFGRRENGALSFLVTASRRRDVICSERSDGNQTKEFRCWALFSLERSIILSPARQKWKSRSSCWPTTDDDEFVHLHHRLYISSESEPGSFD